MGELPKLFGKAFAVGFLLPAVAFALALGGLLTRYGVITDAVSVLLKADLVGVTVLVAVVWLGAVCLMALNRPIIRAAEGYLPLNPLQLLRPLQVRRFKTLAERIACLEDERDRTPPRAGVEEDLATALRRQVEDFPDREAFVLPTRFGNVMRAYEVYPRVIYGLEGIQGWTRLVAVLPESFRLQIEDAKSQTDFWINLWAVSILLLCIHAGFVVTTWHLKHLWMAVVTGGVSAISLAAATSMAREWGTLVMAAFDLYRGDLAKALGLDLPRSIDHERRMWTAFSETTVYRSRDSADDLGPFRAEAKAGRDA